MTARWDQCVIENMAEELLVTLTRHDTTGFGFLLGTAGLPHVIYDIVENSPAADSGKVKICRWYRPTWLYITPPTTTTQPALYTLFLLLFYNDLPRIPSLYYHLSNFSLYCFSLYSQVPVLTTKLPNLVPIKKALFLNYF